MSVRLPDGSWSKKLKDERTYPQKRERRAPKPDNFDRLLGDARDDLAELGGLYRLVDAHFRLGGVRLPAGSEGGGHALGVHSDPVSDAVLKMFKAAPECEECDEYGNCPEHMVSRDVEYVDGPAGKVARLRPAHLPIPPRDDIDEQRLRQAAWYQDQQAKKALLMALDALARLSHARRALTGCAQQQAANLHKGRALTTGMSDVEIAALNKGWRSPDAPDAEACVACGEMCGPSRRHGFRDACRMAWERAGEPPRHEWILKRRVYLAAKAQEKREMEAQWDPALHFSRGPADGVDRRAA